MSLRVKTSANVRHAPKVEAEGHALRFPRLMSQQDAGVPVEWFWDEAGNR